MSRIGKPRETGSAFVIVDKYGQAQVETASEAMLGIGAVLSMLEQAVKAW